MKDLSLREFVVFAPLLVLAFWIGLYPSPFLRRLETSVGRVVARVNSVYAPVVARGSDCATAPLPPAPSPDPLPGMALVAGCADGSTDAGNTPTAGTPATPPRGNQGGEHR
jgi:NADH-quinone oxidoreductase subunit M